GAKCPHYDACFVTRMRRKAEEADIVLVNHHLFLADLALRTGQAGEGVLPSYEAVIFDEAHALEDVATQYFGLSVSHFRFEHLASDVQRSLSPHDPRMGSLAAVAVSAQSRSSLLFDAAMRRLRLTSDASARLQRGTLEPLLNELGALEKDLLSLAALT